MIRKKTISATEKKSFSNCPPLLANTVNFRFDKRRVSFRWFGSAILIGIASSILMGGALFAALNGLQHVVTQKKINDIVRSGPHMDNYALAPKGSKLIKNVHVRSLQNRTIRVPTITKQEDHEIVAVRPFRSLTVSLSGTSKAGLDYPDFDPLAIFAETKDTSSVAVATNSIYEANVEGEVIIKIRDFSEDNSHLNHSVEILADKAEVSARTLSDNWIKEDMDDPSLLAYFDDSRFNIANRGTEILSNFNVRITPENVLTLKRNDLTYGSKSKFQDHIVTIHYKTPITEILNGEGIPPKENAILSDMFIRNLGSNLFIPGDYLRIVYEFNRDGSIETVARVSIYHDTDHRLTVARSDQGNFVYANMPSSAPKIGDMDTLKYTATNSRTLNIYNGIYQATMNKGLNKNLVHRLIQIFSSNVDFKSKISPKDELSVFYSLEENEKSPAKPSEGERSEILFASIKTGDQLHRYYRFMDPKTGKIDYYDPLGANAKKFLLRKPLPNGRFKSGFGMRFHPILKYRKMHSGVDWAAARGTPIIASGDGIIEKIGWDRSGFGKRIVIRHVNGYKTTYAHQTAFAKGLVRNARVKQGQIIGYVGSTGLSTGPHLHYEVSINNNKVDPLRIRLPQGLVLKNRQLAKFKQERDRIDKLLMDPLERRQRYASHDQQ